LAKITSKEEVIAQQYCRFSSNEAAGVSARYEALALSASRNSELLKKLALLPPEKVQPNLLFGVLQMMIGDMESAEAKLDIALSRWDEVSDEIMHRSTQTNEPGRCATLLPLLAKLPQPLALLEVGASAGLCLIPDFYDYKYGKVTLRGKNSSVNTPVFQCDVTPDGVIPTAMPEIVWRAGIDIEPVDIENAGSREWLEALVWPEHKVRRENLRRAIEISRNIRPEIHRFRLEDDFSSVIETAPRNATLIIFHSAVLAYVDRRTRAQFAERLAATRCIWISNEAVGVIKPSRSLFEPPVPQGSFELRCNGQLVAETAPHGQWMNWKINDATQMPATFMKTPSLT